jgi:phosphoglycolate phosphatase
VVSNWVNATAGFSFMDVALTPSMNGTGWQSALWLTQERTQAKAVVFDFDGTIADSLSVAIEVANRLAGEFGMEQITPEQYDRWRNLSSREILKELRLPLFRLPKLISRFSQELRQEIHKFPLIPGMREAILELWDRGYVLGIVTSNSSETVRAFLEAQQLDHLFDFIESCPKVMGKDRMLKRLAKHHALNMNKMLYVGDETRDIDAANRCKAFSVGVTWGFNSSQALKSHHPDYLIDQPSQLVAIAKNL